MSSTRSRAAATRPSSVMPSRGEAAVVDGVAAIGADDRGIDANGSALFGCPVEHAELLEPPDQVVAAIAARQARGLADGEKHAAAGAVQLFGDLRARCAGADHEHGAVREVARD